MRGTVHGTGGGVYRIVLDDGRAVDASIRGRVKREARAGSRVVVGDRVQVEPGVEGAWTIEAVEARTSQVVRRSGPSRRAKVVAANVDRMLVTVAALDPQPRLEVIDRLLVLAEADQLAATLVVNKIDLPGAEKAAEGLLELYRGVGYEALSVSAASGYRLSALEEVLSRGTSVLLGPSGVGKSSLLNALAPELALRTGELSGKSRRGRHTTVSSRLIRLDCGGLVADTPGFAEVGLWGVELVELDQCFPEMRALRDRCRFRGCTHLSEPECAVREALQKGEIPASRHASYRLLRGELEAAEIRRPSPDRPAGEG
jgi:ribosome biogenesis GTPase / thiamine phosphate phosphatase